MQAYKWLDEGGVDPEKGFAWPKPEGGQAAELVKLKGAFGAGSHAVDAAGLAEGIRADLWEVDLVEPVNREEDKLVAKKGRLVQPVSAWTPDVAREFARETLLRARNHTADALRGTEAQLRQTQPTEADQVGSAASALAEAQAAQDVASAASHAASVAHAALGGHDPRGGAAAQVLSGAGQLEAAPIPWMAASAITMLTRKLAALGGQGTSLADGQNDESARVAGLARQEEERAWQSAWLGRRLLGIG